MSTSSIDLAKGDAAARPSWPLLRGFRGLQSGWLGPDLLAGLTLAAIAVPEQMATARLAGLAPRAGFFAFIAGAIAFAVFGSSRRLSVGADSTIAPIFAGALAMLAATGSPRFAALAAALALITGALTLAAGALGLGWIARLLSIPVTTGFLAGIAVHIAASQGATALGVSIPHGSLPREIVALALALPRANLGAVAVAAGVMGVIWACHAASPRLPGAMIAVVLATAATAGFGSALRGLPTLGTVAGGLPSLSWPAIAPADALAIAPLALLLSLIIMGQTAATIEAFADGAKTPDIDRDFIGVGAGSLLSGLLGAFPVNASPPRTAIVVESGGRSPLAALAAAVLVAALLAFGTGALRDIPLAALSGVLLFIALRLIRIKDIAAIVRASPGEGALVVATAVAIVVLPIATGVATGVALSLFHGAWANARGHVARLERIPGTTVWWPPDPGRRPPGERLAGVAVLGFPAPLTFLNAESFAGEARRLAFALDAARGLVVLECAGLIDLDFTGARALRETVLACRARGLTFAIARLESPAAQAAFVRHGLTDLIGEDHMFESVAAAISAFAPAAE